jgi:hypothetical protein
MTAKRRTKQPPSRRPEQRGMVRSHLVLLERGMRPEPADEEASSTKEAIWVWGTRQTGYGVRGWGGKEGGGTKEGDEYAPLIRRRNI